MGQNRINQSPKLHSLFLKSTGRFVSSDGLVAGIVRRNLYFDQIQTQCGLRGILLRLSINAVTHFLQTPPKKYHTNGHLKKIQSP